MVPASDTNEHVYSSQGLAGNYNAGIAIYRQQGETREGSLGISLAGIVSGNSHLSATGRRRNLLIDTLGTWQY